MSLYLANPSPYHDKVTAESGKSRWEPWYMNYVCMHCIYLLNLIIHRSMKLERTVGYIKVNLFAINSQFIFANS